MRNGKFIPNWSGLWRFFTDAKTDWKPKAMALAAIVYLVIPFDLLPDFAPVLGWLDDIGLGAFAVWYLLKAANKYLEDKS